MVKIKHILSNFGRVKSKYDGNKKEKLLAQAWKEGYLVISLNVEGKRKYLLAHRLVAQLFVSNPKGYQIIDHCDTNTRNNIWTNLRWVESPAQNASNPLTRNKRINKNPILQLDMNTRNVIRLWPNARSVHVECNWHSGNILRCCRWQRKSAYGFNWEFQSNVDQ